MGLTRRGAGLWHHPGGLPRRLAVNPSILADLREVADYPINHSARGYSIYLFVRLNRNNGPLTAPFQFLGRGTQVSYSCERPIAMVWALDHPMPAELLEANRVGGGRIRYLSDFNRGEFAIFR